MPKNLKKKKKPAKYANIHAFKIVFYFSPVCLNRKTYIQLGLFYSHYWSVRKCNKSRTLVIVRFGHGRATGVFKRGERGVWVLCLKKKKKKSRRVWRGEEGRTSLTNSRITFEERLESKKDKKRIKPPVTVLSSIRYSNINISSTRTINNNMISEIGSYEVRQ